MASRLVGLACQNFAREEEGRETGWTNKLGFSSLPHQLALVPVFRFRGKWKCTTRRVTFACRSWGPCHPRLVPGPPGRVQFPVELSDPTTEWNSSVHGSPGALCTANKVQVQNSKSQPLLCKAAAPHKKKETNTITQSIKMQGLSYRAPCLCTNRCQICFRSVHWSTYLRRRRLGRRFVANARQCYLRCLLHLSRLNPLGHLGLPACFTISTYYTMYRRIHTLL